MGGTARLQPTDGPLQDIAQTRGGGDDEHRAPQDADATLWSIQLDPATGLTDGTAFSQAIWADCSDPAELLLSHDGLRIAAEQNPANAEILLAANPFAIFLQTIPFLFYPLLAVTFVLMTSAMDKDFDLDQSVVLMPETLNPPRCSRH